MESILDWNEYHDIDHLIQTAKTASYDAGYVQLESGRLHVQCATNNTRNLGFVLKRVNRSIECFGTPRDDCYAFTLSLRNSYRLNGLQCGESELYVVPPGAEIQLVTRQGSLELLSIAVPRHLVESNWDISNLLSTSSILSLRADLEAETRLLTCFKAIIDSSLDHQTQADLEDLMLDCLRSILLENFSNTNVWQISASHAKNKKLNLLRRYIHDRLDRSIRIDELSGLAGLNERSLQRLFKEAYGVSPTRYIQISRLEAARHSLTSSSSEVCLITQVAMQQGFLHLGRFSRDFREHFGILPSELRRIQS